MDELIEYHKLILLASNLIARTGQSTMSRPSHPINHTKNGIGNLKTLFEKLDDTSLSLIPNAQMVGAAQDGHEMESSPLLIVV